MTVSRKLVLAFSTVVLILTATLGSQKLLAQTVYVADEFFVPMRSGAGNKFRIIRNLKTGQAMEVIGRTGDDQWIHVRVQDKEGWVPSQYVMNRPTRAAAQARAESRVAKLQQELSELKGQLATLTDEKASVDGSLSSNQQAYSTLQAEHERLQKLSAGAVEIDRNYRQLLVDFQELETRQSVMENENTALLRDRQTTFMLYGVGFVLLGMLLAILLPALKRKPRHSEWK